MAARNYINEKWLLDLATPQWNKRKKDQMYLWKNIKETHICYKTSRPPAKFLYDQNDYKIRSLLYEPMK